MKSDLQHLVDHWSNQSFIKEQRSVTEQPSPGVANEVLLTLRIEVTINVGNLQETIRKIRLFHTFENNSTATTSSGDCYRFNHVSSALVVDFNNEYETTLNKMIEDQFGSGFTS